METTMSQSKNAFGSPGRLATGGSSEDEDDVIYFNSQMNNLTFVSDEDEASGKPGRSPVGHKRTQPTAAAVSTDPNTVQVNYGSLPLMAPGMPVQALSPEALHTGLNNKNTTAMNMNTNTSTASSTRTNNLPNVAAGASFPTFQVRDPEAQSLQHQPQALGLTASMSALSPQSHSTLEGNTYHSIMGPPTNGYALEFRRYYEDDENLSSFVGVKSQEELIEMEAIPDFIRNEESAGIFVGQLPASYSESDIKLLLKSLAKQSDFDVKVGEGKLVSVTAGAKKPKRYVEVREVKPHSRDKTCAFIMINASSLLPILDFSKRVLCDVQCVYVCGPDKKNEINYFVSRFPREVLRGVPKAALVLEKLTPQGKSGGHGKGNQHHDMAQQQQQVQMAAAAAAAAAMGGGLMYPGAMTAGPGFMGSPIGGRIPNPAAPAFVPSSMMGGGFMPGNGNMGGGFFMGGAPGLGSPTNLTQRQQQQQQQMHFGGVLGLGPYGATMSPKADGAGAPAVSVGGGSAGLRSTAQPFLGPNANFHGSVTSLNNFQGILGNAPSIATIEAANQARIAASRSRQNSIASNDANKSSGSPIPATHDHVETSSAPSSAAPPASHLHCASKTNNSEEADTPTAGAKVQPVSLPSSLQGVKCSCGYELVMSKVPDLVADDEPSVCEICKTKIDAHMVICYTCPQAHIFVCSLCGIKHMQRVERKRQQQQQPPKPKFTLVGLDTSGADGDDANGANEGSSGESPSGKGTVDGINFSDK